MKQLELYLAHPLDNRKQIREWELAFEKMTGINLINPFYDIVRTDIELIDLGRERYKFSSAKEIVERDTGFIKNKTTDGTLAFITGALSYGTIMEMVYTKLYKKNLFTVVTNGHENHPWLKYHSDKIFKSKEDFENWISKDCKYKCGGIMNLVGMNNEQKFDMYLCNHCNKSWLEMLK
jgi:nucleoside 2-deoxyribosyltransferase